MLVQDTFMGEPGPFYRTVENMCFGWLNLIHQLSNTTHGRSRSWRLDQVPRANGLLEAWTPIGVTLYASCLFSKLDGYTFLYWLPFYTMNKCQVHAQLLIKFFV